MRWVGQGWARWRDVSVKTSSASSDSSCHIASASSSNARFASIKPLVRSTLSDHLSASSSSRSLVAVGLRQRRGWGWHGIDLEVLWGGECDWCGIGIGLWKVGVGCVHNRRRHSKSNSLPKTSESPKVPSEEGRQPRDRNWGSGGSHLHWHHSSATSICQGTNS